MRENLPGAIWRLAVFMTVCGIGLFAMVAVFGQLRFGDEPTYHAVFTNVTGLEAGNFVRIAGVEVGKVKKISIQSDGTALVVFSADQSVVLTEGSRAIVRYQNLIGGRYLALEEGVGGTRRLHPGDTIPPARTTPALDLDALIGGFRPLFQALNPDQINALSAELIGALQGEGPTINSFLSHTAALTSALADRDDLVGLVIANLDTVLGTLGDRSAEFAGGIDSLSQLVGTLAERKQDIGNAIAYANEAANSVTDLLIQAREPFQQFLHQSDRAAQAIVAERDYLSNLLETLPDAYQMLNRQGLYGDYFAFYLCDLILKVNGKGGQPVYIKLAGQSSGRCAPL